GHPHDVVAELAVLRAALSRDHCGCREERQCAPRGMDIARAPAVPLVEADEEIAEERARERKSEEMQSGHAPTQSPPAGEREHRQAGHRPAPEAHLLTDPLADRFVHWKG